MHLIEVPRHRNKRTLPCVHCGADVAVCESTVRVICADCTRAGKTFPRDHQTELAIKDSK